MADDSYRTIQQVAEGYYTEKRSRFISYAIPVRTVEEVKEELDKYRKQYYDARHVCWAYMLGADRQTFRANDDGEPSSTAGKPILGQINSNELTDILIIVVRYFGGIELGTSGLIVAYRCRRSDCRCRDRGTHGRRRHYSCVRIPLSERDYADSERRQPPDCVTKV